MPSAKLTQRYAHIHNYADLTSITLQQIEHFFAHYKDLEPNKRFGEKDRALGDALRPDSGGGQ